MTVSVIFLQDGVVMFVSTAARSTCTGMLWKMILIERATMPLVIELFLVIFKATVASVEIHV